MRIGLLWILMSKDTLYTIVLDYKGGLYIGQAFAASVTNAVAQWLFGESDEELARWRITRKGLTEVISDLPIPLDGCTNVWCLSGSVRGGLALINVIATEQSRMTRRSTRRRQH
jgi:hypothetical protein